MESVYSSDCCAHAVPVRQLLSHRCTSEAAFKEVIVVPVWQLLGSIVVTVKHLRVTSSFETLYVLLTYMHAAAASAFFYY